MVKVLKAIAYLLDNPVEGVRAIDLMKGIGMVEPDVEQLTDANRRAFERLKETIREFGIPLEMNETTQFADGQQEEVNAYTYHILPRRYVLRNLNLTDEEDATLRLMGHYIAQKEDFPLRTHIALALQKLSARGSGLSGQSLLGDVISHSPEPAQPQQDPDLLDQLLKCGTDHKTVSFRYQSFHSNQVSQRRVEPYGFFTRKGLWYMVGRDCDKDAVRVFRVSRIDPKGVKSLAQGSYAIPDNFRMKDYSSVPPWNFLYENPPVEATIEISGDDFWRVEGFCRDHGQVSETGRDAWLWKLEVRDFDPLIRWMLPFGSGMIPKQPEEFVSRYRTLVRKTLDNYKENSTSAVA